MPIDAARLRLPTMPHDPPPQGTPAVERGLRARLARWQRGPRQRLLLTSQGVLDAQGQAWADFGTWCQGHPGARVELLAGPDRIHSLCVPEDLPLPDDEALARYARLQFTHYFGPAAQTWPLCVDGRVACAWLGEDLAGLKSTAAQHRVRLLSLRPSWTLVPADVAQASLIDGALLTWLRQEGGRVVELQQRPADPELLQDLAPSDPTPSLDRLKDAVPHRGPDFVPQPAPGRAWVWAWMAAAASACALMAWQAEDQRAERERLTEQDSVLSRLERPATRASVSPMPVNPAARARAWGVARQLDTDWAHLWTDVERALPPGVQLVALDLDRQGLRLEGLATDADAVTRLVDRLALAAAPGEEVVLTRLQRPDTGADMNRLRFELVRRAGGMR